MAEEKAQNEAPEKVAKTVENVTNIGQAIHVLVQAADMGRKAGIYDWKDLNLISQAMGIITASAKPPEGSVKNTEAATEITPNVDNTAKEAPKASETPEIATEE